ncbi:MAG: phosphoadenosine phosphosulfate reductase family protein [Candidatus Thermoplasmatota archaeon]|nr:phosphoadenosine phosphosulfate reductase family protein [Candidatus Thermoplasmatota archaeon]
MARVFHGRMDLHWCVQCRSPLIKGGACPACGSPSKEVAHTPPGDIRPAFLHDLDEIISLADAQWGEGAGAALIDPDEPVVLNPCPAPDRLDEVISGGQVIGSISFSLQRMRSSLILREAGGRALARRDLKPSRGYVTVDDSVPPFLFDGKNLLCPGIVDADVSIMGGEEVLVLEGGGRIIASGSARKTGREMVGTTGLGVKIRWAGELSSGKEGPPGEPVRELSREEGWKKAWKRAVVVNRPHLDPMIKRSVEFIRKLVSRNDLPLAVSYSGGKDSMATLLLALEAGLRPPILFIDTGLEFPETVDHVHSFVKELGLELIEGRPVSGFFENLERFGPPGRDFRWCCKLCKLGPMARMVDEHFPDGVLTLIGQRRFESDTREQKGPVWKNPWVPKQTGASPVQNWTALDVWLFLFSREAPYNELYAKGYPRIGCWLCPSCDMAEIGLVTNTRVDSREWVDLLERERKEAGLPLEWTTMGYHRFRELPPHMVRLASETGLKVATLSGRRRRGSGTSVLEMVDGTNTCDDGISREGILGKEVSWEDLVDLLNILGKVEKDPGTGGITVTPDVWSMKRKAIEVFSDGTLVIRAPDRKELGKLNSGLLSIVRRAAGCIGCSICVGRCPHGALKVHVLRGKVELDPSRCRHCSSCLGPCPAEVFIDDPFVV